MCRDPKYQFFKKMYSASSSSNTANNALRKATSFKPYVQPSKILSFDQILWVFSASWSTNSSNFWLRVIALRSSGAGLYPFDCKNGSFGRRTLLIRDGGLSREM